jgi:hypothetical protein
MANDQASDVFQAGTVQVGLQPYTGTNSTGNTVTASSGDSFKFEKTSNKFHLGDGTNIIINCSEIGKNADNSYCNGSVYLEKKSWANPCQENYECISGFCLENKCSRLNKENYTIQQLENKNKELENRLNKLENNSNNKIELVKESWIKKFWNKLFKK